MTVNHCFQLERNLTGEKKFDISDIETLIISLNNIITDKCFDT